MTTLYEPPITEHPEVPWQDPQRTQPRRRPVAALVAVVVVALLFAGFTWWLLDSTVPQSDYDRTLGALEATEAELDAVTAELRGAETARAATEAQLEAAESALEAAETSLGATEAERDAADAAHAAAVTRLDDVREVARAKAFAELNWSQEGFDAYVDAGGDPAAYDDLLDEVMGADVTMQQWIQTWDDYDGAWATADDAIRAVGDEALSEHWAIFNFSERGSEQEQRAFTALWLRFAELTLERLAEG